MAKNTFDPNKTAKSAEVNENFTKTWSGEFMEDASIDTRHLTANAKGVTGSIIGYAGTAASVPAGWLICNGAAVSRTTYADLFAVTGVAYGAGNGSTTFNVPDLLGRVPVGEDSAGSRVPTNNLRGAASGAATVTLTSNEMPVHSHGVNDPGHNHTGNPGGGWGAGPGDGSKFRADANSPAVGWYFISNYSGTGISIQSSGSGGAHNNLQPYLIINYIIKV